MPKARKQKRKAVESFEEFAPTPEQRAKGEFIQGGNLATSANERAGLAYRRVPVIRTLLATGKLSQRQFDGLNRYADIAGLAERSQLRSCIDFSVRGNGSGLPPSLLRANIEMGRLERALGALQPIAHAVVIDQLTLAQWAMQQAGSVALNKSMGEKIVTWFVPRRKAADIALVDIRFAGDRLAAEIGA